MNQREFKVRQLRALLGMIERNYLPVVFASSFGAEDMVLTHLIASEFNAIEIITLDTLRLPMETYSLISVSRKKYTLNLGIHTPPIAAVIDFEKHAGLFSMYESVENRKACCHLRKVEPLERALAGKQAWLTGLRREQAPSRSNLRESEFDTHHQIVKFNPLIEWSNDDVWSYLHANNVPYNALHDKSYPSIGCEPCTRAIKPGEDSRAGRWWWENEAAGGQQECGLHVKDAGVRNRKSKIGATT